MTLASTRNQLNQVAGELRAHEESASKHFNDYIGWRIATRQIQKRLTQIGTLSDNTVAIDNEVETVETMLG